jgi:hypothetical protein
MFNFDIVNDLNNLPIQFMKALPSSLACGMLRPQSKQSEQRQQALPRLYSLADWP